MQRKQYTTEFKEQALIKSRQRGARTLESIATQINVPLGSLKGWLKASNRQTTASLAVASLPSDTAAQHWSRAQRLQALLESHALTAPALNAWCREKGLFEHQLKQWREAFCNSTDADSRQSKADLRELKTQNDQLQRDLHRKDRALAETAALLVLQKKFQALLEGADK